MVTKINKNQVKDLESSLLTITHSYIDVRVRHDNGGDVDLTTRYANLNVTYIGDI